MATMPTRAGSFDAAFQSIASQVDSVYLYLDVHEEIPEVARRDGRVVPILSREMPDLHGNGKFLSLVLEPARFLFVGIDDDIVYPADYVERLAAAMSDLGGRAVVGYHGST